jgi:hypothetical protein
MVPCAFLRFVPVEPVTADQLRRVHLMATGLFDRQLEQAVEKLG